MKIGPSYEVQSNVLTEAAAGEATSTKATGMITIAERKYANLCLILDAKL